MSQPPNRSRVIAIVIGVGIVVVAVVVAAIIVGTRDNGSGKQDGSGSSGNGSAVDAATGFVNALQDNSTSEVQAAFCPGASAKEAIDLVGSVKSATLKGAVNVTGGTATASLSITGTVHGELPPGPSGGPPHSISQTSTYPGSIGLGQRSNRWCVMKFEAQQPTF